MAKLNTFVAQKKREIFEDLTAGKAPREGTYDEELLRLAKLRGKPQMGATTYEPHSLGLEFVFHDPTTSALVFTVDVAPPERVVFLPVPGWVVETIWQGEISGSYCFESEAEDLIATFKDSLTPKENSQWFGKQQARRRE
ncbi:MAG: hypothetical protein MUC92_08415 [Fimbriimonadaceae bacterium]|jgi:hypothetical protein|nr:hypothetical protein [Fimbriimonadaceae bacterium]